MESLEAQASTTEVCGETDLPAEIKLKESGQEKHVGDEALSVEDAALPQASSKPEEEKQTESLETSTGDAVDKSIPSPVTEDVAHMERPQIPAEGPKDPSSTPQIEENEAEQTKSLETPDDDLAGASSEPQAVGIEEEKMESSHVPAEIAAGENIDSASLGENAEKIESSTVLARDLDDENKTQRKEVEEKHVENVQIPAGNEEIERGESQLMVEDEKPIETLQIPSGDVLDECTDFQVADDAKQKESFQGQARDVEKESPESTMDKNKEKKSSEMPAEDVDASGGVANQSPRPEIVEEEAGKIEILQKASDSENKIVGPSLVETKDDDLTEKGEIQAENDAKMLDEIPDDSTSTLAKTTEKENVTESVQDDDAIQGTDEKLDSSKPDEDSVLTREEPEITEEPMEVEEGVRGAPLKEDTTEVSTTLERAEKTKSPLENVGNENETVAMDIDKEKQEEDKISQTPDVNLEVDSSSAEPETPLTQDTDKETESESTKDLTAGGSASPMDTSSKSPIADILGESRTATKAGSAEKRGKTASKGFNLGSIVSRLMTQMESKKEEEEVTEVKKDGVDSVPEKTQSKRSEQKQMRAAAQATMMMYEDAEFDDDAESRGQTGVKKGKDTYDSAGVDEMLGLYGYDKQSNEESANLQLSSSLSQSKTPITGSVGNLKPNQKLGQTARPNQGETGLVISNVTSMAPAQKVADAIVQEAARKKATYCAECSSVVNDDVTLISSGRSFCTQACLDKYQNRQTLVCDYCSGMITQGADKKFVRETRAGQKKFCSQTCSDEFSKRVRNCNTCGEEISKASEGILAPVGTGGKFLDFCKQECVDNYGKKTAVIKQVPAKADGTQPKYWSQETFFACAVCSNHTKAKHVISLQGKLNGLCSTECFAQFKERNQLAFSLCSQCSALCSNQKMMRSIEIEGKINRFCSMRCFKMKLKRSMSTIPCAACKKPNWAQNMIEEWNGTELVRFFCSTACLGKREIIPFTGAAPKTVPVSKTVLSAQSLKTTPMAIKQQKAPQVVQMVNQSNVTRLPTPAGNKCDHCSKQQRPQYHLTMSDNSIRNFCSYACVIAFQAQFNVPPVTLPQETLQLTCSQCSTGFSTKPLALDFKSVVNVFCTQNCLDEFKRVNSVVMECDYCHLEKILHECIYFSGQARSFCSEGCKLLFKQQFAQRLGLRCTVCDYCAQTCRSRAEHMYGNVKKKFCSTACRTQYDKWLSKGAKCDGCKCTGRKLEENFMWRGEMKRVCNQHCLLLFYTQQNIPNMSTQTQATIPAIQLTQTTPKTTTPVITNVMSLAPIQQQAGPPGNNVQYQPKAITQTTDQANLVRKCHKQTQITTAPPKTPRPPPPPMPLPPAPKMVKNKVTLVKPFVQTKSVSCRPLTASKKTMTDEQHPLIIPIPVPIYVPVPMHMYTTPVPHPITFPVPVPVPLFLPVAHNNVDRLLATIKDIIQKFPSDPLEAEMLMLADAIAGDGGKSDKASKADERLTDMARILPTDEGDRDDLSSLTIDEMDDMSTSTLTTDNILKMAADIAQVLNEDPSADLQDDLNSLQAVEEPKIEPTPKTTKSRTGRVSGRRGRNRGNKRACVEEPSTPEPEEPPQPKRSKEESRVSVGVNAYRYFVSQKKNAPEAKELKNLTFNPNPLEVGMEELVYILCLMCKEAKRPDGEKYTADVLHLIFLSVQQHLSDNDRPENIFTDQVYRRFTDLLHDEIKAWVVERNPLTDTISNSCINEETLWNSKQLGAHSPYILLSTMIYFNTKHFQLKTLDHHKALALCRIQKHIRKTGPARSMFLRYYPADRKKALAEPLTKRKRERDPDADLTRLEQSENTENPLRCPVRLYEFYLSKCPDSIRSSTDLFYLVPERSCVPDSPVWYSSAPLADHDMNKILTRMVMVTNVHDAWGDMTDEDDE